MGALRLWADGGRAEEPVPRYPRARPLPSSSGSTRGSEVRERFPLQLINKSKKP